IADPVAGHLLVLEALAGILTSAGRTDRTMRYRDTVGGAKPAEIPALHAAGKALTDRGAGDVDELADHEMVGLNLGANRDQRVFRSEEHTSELQSLRHLVCRLLLEKKKYHSLQ